MKKKANLYTSASLNASWLLISIDCALWLYKSDGFKKITINCISNYNPINLFNLLLRLKNLSSYLNKSKFNKLWKFLKLSKTKNLTNTNLSDLARFANGKTDKAFLKIDDLEIIFKRKKLIKKKSIINSIFLSYITVKDYKNYFSKSALKSKKYLEYKVDNIFSGLHVMSESLRTDYKSCGSVFKCRLGILTTIYKLHKFLKEYKQLNLEKENQNFVIGPAQEYIYGFFSRFMTEQGACYIDNTGKQKSYVKRQLNDKYFSRLKIIPQEKYLNIDKKKISDYYQLRIQKPWDVFDDIYFLKQNYTSNNGLIKLNGVSVIVYLHSFTDAQYVYGYDGYHDLMDWASSTISLLNSNIHVSKIIVKPHPGINPIYHPGDLIANEYLKSKFSKLDKVNWANFHFDVNHIKSSGLVIGITHHGSVAEELVFNRIPVIASTNSPWGEEYKFGHWWKSTKDYESMISSEIIKNYSVTKNHIDELYRYATDQYFHINSENYFSEFSTWQDLLKINEIDDRNDFAKNMEYTSYLVSKLNPEDPKFKKYISTRLHRINLL